MEGTSSLNDTDAGLLDESDGNIVTMCDVLEEEEELEEQAYALLGDVDDKTCTYAQGYLKRQPLYACATCTPPDAETKPAGVCLACCYRCHDGHVLTELYTKRNFRCDCGNSNFKTKCSLEPDKDTVNEKNRYNQNFKGLYCTCNRPYPDEEDNVPDEMIQCVICEDWFHGRHLEGEGHSKEDFAEMICQMCMGTHMFLWKYAGFTSKKSTLVEESATSVDVENIVKETQVETVKDAPVECSLGVEDGGGPAPHGATFWPEGWRKNLCRCTKCLTLYKELEVEFLLEERDTVHHYEKLSKANTKETWYEKGMKALSGMDRTYQLEAIHGYNEMKTELMNYLQKFATNKKVVREEDIKEFFSQMQARKRPRVEIPYNCR